MTTRLPLAALLSLLCPISASVSAQETLAPGTGLFAEVAAAKPLVLEVCYAENDFPLKSRPLSSDDDRQEAVMTADFYAHSVRATSAVAAGDIGLVGVAEHVDAAYRLSSATDDKGRYTVAISLNFHLAGRQNLPATLLLKPGHWAVHSTFTRKVAPGDIRYFYALVRLVEARPGK